MTPEDNPAAEQITKQDWQAGEIASLRSALATERAERLRVEGEAERLKAQLDPAICRLQFPDGSVPADLQECAQGWKRRCEEAIRANGEMHSLHDADRAELFQLRKQNTEQAAQLKTLGELVEAAHASAPEGCKCSDCSIDNEPCPTCYAAWWKKRHPNVEFIDAAALSRIPASTTNETPATCDCAKYNGGQCYNCLNGAHDICDNGHGECNRTNKQPQPQGASDGEEKNRFQVPGLRGVFR